jgi:hypothetical protein
VNVTGIRSVGVAGALIALLQALIALLVSFGVDVTAEQGAAITAVATGLVAVWSTRKVKADVATALYTPVPVFGVEVSTEDPPIF